MEVCRTSQDDSVTYAFWEEVSDCNLQRIDEDGVCVYIRHYDSPRVVKKKLKKALGVDKR